MARGPMPPEYRRSRRVVAMTAVIGLAVLVAVLVRLGVLQWTLDRAGALWLAVRLLLT